MSVSAYLQGFGFPTKGYSLVRGVRIVAPGTVIKVRRSERAQTSEFASLVDLWDRDETARFVQLNSNQLVDRFDELFQQSIKDQLFADESVGAYCSGGVDSSLVMAVASKLHDNPAIFHANVLSNSETYAASELAWIPIGAIHLRFLNEPVGRTGRKSAKKSERSALGGCATPYETT